MTPGKPKTLKRNNRKAILDLLRSVDTTTVAEISKTVGLSKTTVMKILDYYVNQQIILRIGKGASTNEGGKKPVLFRFNNLLKYVIGIHILPTEVYAAIMDLNLNIIHEKSVTIQENENPEKVVQFMIAISESLIQQTGIGYDRVIGIAIGTHGITNYDEGIVYTSPHFPSWGENTSLKSMMMDAMPVKVPLYIDNQIRFQAFAEKTLGLGKNKKNVIIIEGGEGLVAGILMNGEIQRGIHYLAGEIGHMILSPDDSVICSCGGSGCFESLISVSRVLSRTTTEIHAYPDSVLAKEEDAISIDAVFQAAESGDAFSRSILEEVLKWFSIGISNIMLMYDPEIIIIQGIYARAGTWFLQRLEALSNACSLTHIKKSVELKYSNLGKERCVLGGAAFILSHYFSRKDLYDL